MVHPIRSELLERAGLRHGFFTRQGGSSSGIYASLNCGLGSDDDRARVVENRARAAAALGLTADCFITPYQTHSARAVVADRAWAPGQGPKADAVVTKRPGLAIGVSTADCTPVLFADITAGVVGAAHAGWRGALNGVLEATVEAMESLGADRNRMTAAIGPTISQANYEVGPQFEQRFAERDATDGRFFAAGPSGRAHFDLPAFVAARLAAMNLAEVEDLALCTYADEARFFSFRRTTHRGEGDYGRQVSAIALQP